MYNKKETKEVFKKPNVYTASRNSLNYQFWQYIETNNDKQATTTENGQKHIWYIIWNLTPQLADKNKQLKAKRTVTEKFV